MKPLDVIVVGGGASGMMAAGRAAELGRRVLVLEKNRGLGEKLNITGGGRCNITNAEFDTRSFLAFFGDAGKFLYSPFSRFSVQDTFDFFADRGLPLIVEDRKRAFPETQKASDVTRVLSEYMRENGVQVQTGIRVKSLCLEDGVLTGVETDQGAYQAESIVLATGGAAYVEGDSSGAGFDWLRAAGHRLCEATPDIVPLKVQDRWVKDLSGTTLDPMKITFTSRQGKSLSKTGRILFTHFGISGPLILNSAHEVKNLLKEGPVLAAIDVCPDLDCPSLDRRVLEVFAEHPNKVLRNVIKFLVPTGFSQALSRQLSDELLDTKVNAVTQAARKALIHMLKSLSFTVTGTMGYDWAVVCDGGVDCREVDTRTMQSRIHPNLYIVGDLLHINRPSGGYSLQLCWTTGWVAGENV